MKYANRETEYNKVKEYLQSNISPILIKAYHASGVTSFVKEKLNCFLAETFGKDNIFYVDCSTNESLSKMLFSCLVCSKYVKDLQKLANKKLGIHDKSLFSAALAGIPYVGPLIGYFIDWKNAPPIYTGAYASAIEELLIPFFEKNNNMSFLIIIDSVELLTEASFEFLFQLTRTTTVRLILVRTEDTSQFSKLENYLILHEVNLSSQVNFDQPQIKLIKEIGQLYDLEISTVESEFIIEKSAQNIHSIIQQICSLKNQTTLPAFTEYEKAIILILDIWSNPLCEENLIEIMPLAPIFSFNIEASCKGALQTLQENSIISKTQSGWILSSRHDPRIVQILDSFVEQLVYKNIIYNFLAEYKDSGYNIELRYKLSKELKCTTETDARLYIKQLLLTGGDISSSLLAEAKIDEKEKNDCILVAIKYCRERSYEKAFTWIEKVPKENLADDELAAFRAILLNRVRLLDEAEKEIIKCLRHKGSPANQNILGAYLISTYIHMENLSQARAVFEEMKKIYANKPMYGYLVRNATSAFKGYNEELYEQALIAFQNDEDMFGYYTTLCNKGYALCKNGDTQSALPILEEAMKGLESFPQTNLHIIYNDLGICYLLSDKYEDAYRYLFLAQKLGKNKMPKMFSTINLACAEAMMGYTGKALDRLDNIHPDVEAHKLDRVRQKYYINRLFVEYLHGNRELDTLIKYAQDYPDRYNPEQTRYAIKIYSDFVNSSTSAIHQKWTELFSPCGLVYWYFDPLKLFSTVTI